MIHIIPKRASKTHISEISMKTLWLLGVVGLLFCDSSKSTGPTEPEWSSWHSVTWTYTYHEPGYTESLSSIVGTMIFERLKDSARVRSDGDVVGQFWATNGVDTSRGTAIVWHDGAVVRGTVTLGDSFYFQSSDHPEAWPVLGEYRTAGDTLVYTWAAGDSLHLFSLVIRYASR